MHRYRLHGSALLGAEIVHAQKGSSSFRVERDRHNSWLAQRVAGNPADMGWETQAVMLVPPQHLAQVVTHPNDAPILQALAPHITPSSPA